MTRRGILTFGLVALFLGGCKTAREPVVVFAAASLARAFSTLEERFEVAHPKLDMQLEISGSQTACRKVAELNRRADIVAVADARVIDAILRPEHANFTLRFATNEVVIAHLEHSKATARITADNWPKILLAPGVKLGGVDPNQAPIGYRTRQVWALAEKHFAGRFGPNLASRLAARVSPAHLMPHEGALVQLLRSRVIDYAFVYRSTADDRNLKAVTLAPTVNLGSLGEAKHYATVAVRIDLGTKGKKSMVGAPIVYGLTIPKSVANAHGAEAFVAMLLGEAGQRVLMGAGFRPLVPARSSDIASLPASLRPLVKQR